MQNDVIDILFNCEVIDEYEKKNLWQAQQYKYTYLNPI